MINAAQESHAAVGGAHRPPIELAGFYPDEGGWRWMSGEGVVRPLEGSLPMDIVLGLECAEPSCYPSFPFVVEASIGDRPAGKIVFDHEHRRRDIAVRLEPGDEAGLRLIGRGVFNPARQGLNSDERTLSVRLVEFGARSMAGEEPTFFGYSETTSALASTAGAFVCPLCGGSSYETVYAESASNVVRCCACELAMYWPLPSPEYLSEYYSSQSGYLPSIEETLALHRAHPEAWRERAEMIAGFAVPYGLQVGGRALDVGCAYGFVLSELKAMGYDAYGVELSSETSAYAASQGLHVKNCDLRSAAWQSDFFDFVMQDNVLEHSLDPMVELREVHRVTAPGGLAWAAMPNWESLASKIEGPRWSWKSWPNHLYYYSPKTIRQAFESVGFVVERVWTDGHQTDPSELRWQLIKAMNLQPDALDDDTFVKLAHEVYEKGLGQCLHIIGRKPA